ncbi:MAG TPA: DUF1549 domain-containing protein, partial [Planctomycetaceae bacterium]|nr:DUF1549 domain-containing protein [Planctomycetaceae bacterium]
MFVSVFALLALNVASADEAALRVTPPVVTMKGNFAQLQLLVAPGNQAPSDQTADLTSGCTFASSDQAVVSVLPSGRLIARGNGTATVSIQREGLTGQAAVTVTDVVENPVIDYYEHVRPVLVKAGCAMAACHAAQHGQGGFKLTVFGFDAAADRAAMVREGLGRRVNILNPAESLLLRKPTMDIPHSGGRRLIPGSRDYELLAAWIKGGAPAPTKEKLISKLVVTPNQRVGEPGLKQQLRVDAVFAEGDARDVTAWCRFDSLDEGVVQVTGDGLCTVTGRGQAPVMVRYEGHADVCTYIIPYGPPAQLAGWTDQNFIDTHAATKFRELGIEPSGLCDDPTFLRRIFLDATGTLPTAEEIQEFAADADPQKRGKWIDRVLGLSDHPQRSIYNDRYAAYWTLKWSDLLRNNSRDLQD